MTASKQKRGPAIVRQSVEASSTKRCATAEGGSKKGHSYKRLPAQFRRDGFTFRQIAREGEVAIYEQIWNGCRNPTTSYEVVRIRRREGFQIDGRFIGAAAVYPNSEAWGTDGFTVTDKEAAFAKLRQMRFEQ